METTVEHDGRIGVDVTATNSASVVVMVIQRLWAFALNIGELPRALTQTT